MFDSTKPFRTKRVKGLWNFVKPLAWSLLLALIALALFERLADEMLEGETLQFDTAVRNFVHGFSSPVLTAVMRAFTDIGNMGTVVVCATLACVVLWFKHLRKGAILLAATTAGGVFLMWTLKLLFHRQRPAPYFGITVPSDYSFPSGHALVAFCFYGALASILTSRQQHRAIRIGVWTAAAAMVAGIGVSRIYLGVHYPSDVVAGYLAAACWVAGVSLVYRRFRGHQPQHAGLRVQPRDDLT